MASRLAMGGEGRARPRQRQQAVRQLETYRQLLCDELGIAPSAELEAIVGAALGATTS